MAAASGIFNHTAAAQSLAAIQAKPMDGSSSSGASGSSSSSDSSSSTISANDFLTLLVTEMQNQDPTADTDPNEYVNQLVNVNSLEQLIDINQTLSTDLGSSSSSSSGSSASGQSKSVVPAIGGAPAASTTGSTPATSASSAAQSLVSGTSGIGSSGYAALQALAAKVSSGNLSVPEGSAAADRVGHSLSGQPSSTAVSDSLRRVR